MRDALQAHKQRVFSNARVLDRTCHARNVGEARLSDMALTRALVQQALQMLLSCPPLTKELLAVTQRVKNPPVVPGEGGQTTTVGKGPLGFALQQAVMHVNGKEVQGQQQQDSHELLRILMDGLESEEKRLLELQRRRAQSDADGEKRVTRRAAAAKEQLESVAATPSVAKNQTISGVACSLHPISLTEKVFGGTLASKVTYESFLDLSLPIPRHSTDIRDLVASTSGRPSDSERLRGKAATARSGKMEEDPREPRLRNGPSAPMAKQPSKQERKRGSVKTTAQGIHEPKRRVGGQKPAGVNSSSCSGGGGESGSESDSEGSESKKNSQAGSRGWPASSGPGSSSQVGNAANTRSSNDASTMQTEGGVSEEQDASTQQGTASRPLPIRARRASQTGLQGSNNGSFTGSQGHSLKRDAEGMVRSPAASLGTGGGALVRTSSRGGLALRSGPGEGLMMSGLGGVGEAGVNGVLTRTKTQKISHSSGYISAGVSSTGACGGVSVGEASSIVCSIDSRSHPLGQPHAVIPVAQRGRGVGAASTAAAPAQASVMEVDSPLSMSISKGGPPSESDEAPARVTRSGARLGHGGLPMGPDSKAGAAPAGVSQRLPRGSDGVPILSGDNDSRRPQASRGMTEVCSRMDGLALSGAQRQAKAETQQQTMDQGNIKLEQEPQGGVGTQAQAATQAARRTRQGMKQPYETAGDPGPGKDSRQQGTAGDLGQGKDSQQQETAAEPGQGKDSRQDGVSPSNSLPPSELSNTSMIVSQELSGVGDLSQEGVDMGKGGLAAVVNMEATGAANRRQTGGVSTSGAAAGQGEGKTLRGRKQSPPNLVACMSLFFTSEDISWECEREKAEWRERGYVSVSGTSPHGSGLDSDVCPVRKQVSWSDSHRVHLIPGSWEQRGTNVSEALRGAQPFCRPARLLVVPESSPSAVPDDDATPLGRSPPAPAVSLPHSAPISFVPSSLQPPPAPALPCLVTAQLDPQVRHAMHLRLQPCTPNGVPLSLVGGLINPRAAPLKVPDALGGPPSTRGAATTDAGPKGKAQGLTAPVYLGKADLSEVLLLQEQHNRELKLQHVKDGGQGETTQHILDAVLAAMDCAADIALKHGLLALQALFSAGVHLALNSDSDSWLVCGKVTPSPSLTCSDQYNNQVPEALGGAAPPNMPSSLAPALATLGGSWEGFRPLGPATRGSSAPEASASPSATQGTLSIAQKADKDGLVGWVYIPIQCTASSTTLVGESHGHRGQANSPKLQPHASEQHPSTRRRAKQQDGGPTPTPNGFVSLGQGPHVLSSAAVTTNPHSLNRTSSRGAHHSSDHPTTRPPTHPTTQPSEDGIFPMDDVGAGGPGGPGEAGGGLPPSAASADALDNILTHLGGLSPIAAPSPSTIAASAGAAHPGITPPGTSPEARPHGASPTSPAVLPPPNMSAPLDILSPTYPMANGSSPRASSLGGLSPRMSGGSKKSPPPFQRPARKLYKIHNPPQVLVLHLKRFEQGDRGTLTKVATVVTFGLSLDIRPFVTVEVARTEPCLQYSLIGLIEHSGQLKSGHYIAYVRRKVASSTPMSTSASEVRAAARGRGVPPNLAGKGAGDQEVRGGLSPVEDPLYEWFHISDTIVKRVKASKVVAAQAYMLCYIRNDVMDVC
eukprot:gene24037-9615_t